MYQILVIEDDTIIRQELQMLLKKYGYESQVIKDFEHAVSDVIAINPHLILLDVDLPFYDGYHLCREIRKQSKVPIIIVTSRDSEVDELMSMNLGADDFITKPYNTQILLARISALLNRSYSEDHSKNMMFLELILNIGKSIVTFKNESRELTKNELRILQLLIKSKGEIVSRDDMMIELWQSDEFVDDNTLTVNINRLRKKLSEIGAEGLLKTKRGLGYSLCK